ncbi:translation factor Guf1, mitochondrial-like [Dreissena polymorpha]|uniref:Translation factor GUF1 homolog, mitochondrial n=1 Tax=Dreissena polymorpha TaxID=45954 RepID=A0A9D4K6Q5_DREPO|nr:translation factor Guf1, mitochondrial-like [Dreissena polymorpha]KAH3834051.1 hypothetical protein DPMN_107369 [Dreissena polymorpha]
MNSILNRYIHVLKKRNLDKHLLQTILASKYFSTSPWLWNKGRQKPDLSEFPPELVRNFSIIAHVDHGKSTLADRFLEYCGVISVSADNKQVLDRLQVEKERGITVKAQTASLCHTYSGTRYLLNLIDTPGHVDFSFEVARSLSACQGVILLIDANQGVQAQTVANFYQAFERDMHVIPVLNKIDLPNARPDIVMEQLRSLFDIAPKEVLKVSAKLGIGIGEVLDAIVKRVPPPKGQSDKPLKCLMFDSWFMQYKGVIASIAVKEGTLRKGDFITLHHSKKSYEVNDVGIMYPTEESTGVLYTGQVGYVTAGIKNIKDALVGDTIYHTDTPVEPLPGFKPAKPMVFAGVYPADQSQLPELMVAMDKLTLNDSSVEVHQNFSIVLGQGWMLGFLGLLHMDVFITRLDQEFNLSTIVTTPNVPYQVTIKGEKNIKQYRSDTVTVLHPSKMPDIHIISEFREPMVRGTVLAPAEFHQDIINLCMSRRGSVPEQTFIDQTRMMSVSKLPLNEILVDFFDELKSITSGYGSFDYENIGYEVSDLIKMEFTINGKEVEELTMLVHRTRARALAKTIIERLKASIPRQLFLITLQARGGGQSLAKEDIKPWRKDVTAKCYGGDVTRKQKLLKQQAEGKKKMRLIGNVEVPRDAFINILKKK